MKNEYNMKINRAKTKVFACRCNEGIQSQTILDSDTFEQVNKYKYIESKITENDRRTKEIINRINQSKYGIQSKKGIFLSRIIDIKLRKNLLEAYV